MHTSKFKLGVCNISLNYSTSCPKHFQNKLYKNRQSSIVLYTWQIWCNRVRFFFLDSGSEILVKPKSIRFNECFFSVFSLTTFITATSSLWQTIRWYGCRLVWPDFPPLSKAIKAVCQWLPGCTRLLICLRNEFEPGSNLSWSTASFNERLFARIGLFIYNT